jgi:hypothetical protein
MRQHVRHHNTLYSVTQNTNKKSEWNLPSLEHIRGISTTNLQIWQQTEKVVQLKISLKNARMRNHIELSNTKINGTPKIKHTYIHFESLLCRIWNPFHIGWCKFHFIKNKHKIYKYKCQLLSLKQRIALCLISKVADCLLLNQPIWNVKFQTIPHKSRLFGLYWSKGLKPFFVVFMPHRSHEI